jgi:hypothetical protein
MDAAALRTEVFRGFPRLLLDARAGTALQGIAKLSKIFES